MKNHPVPTAPSSSSGKKEKDAAVIFAAPPGSSSRKIHNINDKENENADHHRLLLLDDCQQDDPCSTSSSNNNNPKKRSHQDVVRSTQDTTAVSSSTQTKKTKTADNNDNDKNMTCDQVDQLLQALGYDDPSQASKCVKRAIQRGFIVLDEQDKQCLDDQVLFSGVACDHCGSRLECTLRDLLDQPDFGGDDDDDDDDATASAHHRRHGALRCKQCHEHNGYLTGMCEGRFDIDSGKFHNHCTQCEGFGSCLHDYRHVHCDDCGAHYWAGGGATCGHCSSSSSSSTTTCKKNLAFSFERSISSSSNMSLSPLPSSPFHQGVKMDDNDGTWCCDNGEHATDDSSCSIM